MVNGPISVDAVTFDCKANVDLPAPVTLRDLCDENISYTVTGTSNDNPITGNAQSGFTAGNLMFGATEVYYQSEDCCGNVGFDTLTVNITDNVAPFAIAVEFIAVKIAPFGSGPEDIKSKLFAESVDNGSFDNCTDVSLRIRRLDVRCDSENGRFGESVTFCCEDMTIDGWRDNIVELEVTDEFGNTSIAWANVILQSDIVNEVTCPAGMVVSCNEEIDDLSVTGLPTMSGICGDIDLTFIAEEVISNTVPFQKSANADPIYDRDGDGQGDIVPAFDEVCGYGALRRQFFNGTELFCTQFFVVEPDAFFSESNIIWPSDLMTNCSGADPGEPTIIRPDCSKIGFTVESDTLFNEAFGCFRILNTWTVIDWCEQAATGEGVFEFVQNIDVICLLYTSPSPRDGLLSRMPSSA